VIFLSIKNKFAKHKKAKFRGEIYQNKAPKGFKI
jgi:hypothetical protein